MAASFQARADMTEAYKAYGSGKFSEAFVLFEKEAKTGDPAAQFNLAIMYEKGQSRKVDIKKAIDWYKKAASQNFAKAQYNLGLIYVQGKGIEINLEQALGWFSLAADQGMEDAIYNRDMLRSYLATNDTTDSAPALANAEKKRRKKKTPK